ncbi:hypothetical protein GAY28_01015 [Azospirillum brasilense]|nr:hypothetical protein [Azospirillum brasilense]
MSDAELIFATAARFAIPATLAWIGPLVPGGVIGAYMLLTGDKPLYVGRSDSCLRNRLVTHELLPLASHVVWHACHSPRQAYHLEAFWYDRLKAEGQLLNRVHPAKPGFSNELCPYCELAEGPMPAFLSRDLVQPAAG